MLDNSFKKIADNTSSMLWVCNEKKEYVFFNTGWLDFRGTTMNEELIFDWESAIHPQDVVRLQKKFDENFEHRKPYKIEYRLKRHDGTHRWVIESGRPLYNESNQFMGFVGSCLDIHNIKELERRKDEFITAASHELKTPLTSLTIYLHLIQEYFKDNGPDNLKTISEGAIQQLNKINALVEQLLDLKKIQSGSLSYNWNHFSIHDITEDLILKSRTIYPDRNIVFKSNSNVTIWGDVERLSQAIENLLNNAIKFSEEDKEVTIELFDDNANVFLNITDYGIGIDKAYLGRVFDRFFRIPGLKEQTYPGLGMGLYLTKKIIEKHNGKITVESEKNNYTKFSVKIPISNQTTETYGQNLSS